MKDEKFMHIAINVAKKADFPYGAIIAKDNRIIAKAGTASKESLDPTEHAEINAIRKACKKLKSKELIGCTLYSTCEPCPMCFTAAWWAKIDRIVYGMTLKDSSRLMGKELEISCEFLNKKGGNRIKINQILRNECLKMFA